MLGSLTKANNDFVKNPGASLLAGCNKIFCVFKTVKILESSVLNNFKPE